ncbi:hypothetical protein Peur_021369 [Populus x canadensis]
MPDGTIINQKVIYEYKPRADIWESRSSSGGEKSKLSPPPDVSTQHASNAIGPCDSAVAVLVVLNRENLEKGDTTRREHPHQLAPPNVITLSNDSSGFDTTSKGNSESSLIAKFTYTTRSKDLPSILGHGTPRGKSHKKSRMKAVIVDSACD